MSIRTSGRPSRVGERRLHVGRVHDHLRAAGRAQDDVRARELLAQPVEGDGLAAEAPRERLRPLEPVVRDEDPLGAAREEARGRELAHLPGADHEDAPALEVADRLARELGGGGGDRGVRRPDSGLGPDALARVERVLPQAVQRRVRRAALAGELVGLAHLPEDLSLPGKLRVEPGGDAEEPADRVAFALLLEELHGPACRERVARAGRVARDVDLRPVAGREDDRVAELGRELGGLERRQVEGLAVVEAGAAMRDADDRKCRRLQPVRPHWVEPTSPGVS